MNDFAEIRTVFGKKKISKNTVVLSHEHICCYSEYLNMMSKRYFNRNELIKISVECLKSMKKRYHLGLFVDCTPVNIGRDVELLKKVSEMSEVDISCSTGFYYNYEPILDCMSAETLSDFIIDDADNTCAAIIKAAVENEKLSDFNVKLLKAAAIAQRKTGLPIVLHTNANNENGTKAVEVLLRENVPAKSITVGHLSDTDNNEYIKKFAGPGCFVALDRMYDNNKEEYIKSKIKQITDLCASGYENQILLSHDDAVFQGFCKNPENKAPRWNFIFDYIIPELDAKASEKILKENPLRMLCGE